jgi:hypothetical protein
MQNAQSLQSNGCNKKGPAKRDKYPFLLGQQISADFLLIINIIGWADVIDRQY